MKREAPALEAALAQLEAAQLRRARVTVEQRALTGRTLTLAGGRELIDFSSNDYLGLARHPALARAMAESAARVGAGSGASHLITGHGAEHARLEEELADFTRRERALLFSTGYMANLAVIATLAGRGERVLLDRLCHASLIDGARLSGATLVRYPHAAAAAAARLVEADAEHTVLLATDGVFSMDGSIADLRSICDLADRYQALVMVDDCHATGFLGQKGRGTPEHCGVPGRIDILSGTLGKALGGASGGYVSGRKEVVAWLRQRSRPYLFSNALMPAICAASLAVLDLLEKSDDLRARLRANAAHFRSGMTDLGFRLVPGEHPIIPVMLGDAKLASTFADRMLEEGVYVIGFSFPVVPQGQARIRTQMSAAHTTEHLDRAMQAFAKVGRSLGVIN